MHELKEEIKSITYSKQNSLASIHEQMKYLDSKSPNQNPVDGIDIPNFNSFTESQSCP